MSKRSSGILLHITSLPGSEGVGTLGEEAYRFVDFLVETKQKIWQILPLGPVGSGHSPYQCYSAFAGNILLIDLRRLVEEDLLERSDLKNQPRFNSKKAEFLKVEKWKIPLLQKAFQKFQHDNYGNLFHDYQLFLKEHEWWLKDFALFMAAKNHYNKIWTNWPDELKFRKPSGIHKMQEELKTEIDFWKFLQFCFFRQWFALKDYANSKDVQIFGDMPLYVSTDSADVWSNADIFALDKNLMPKEVGGVPPDYFSDDGQLWGNPVFNWDRLEDRDFDWWLARLHFNLNLFNLVRVDHFRGLEAFWSVSADEKTAINGKWKPAKGLQVLEKLQKQIGHLPLIAENLGIITPEVEKLRTDFQLPGMKVLQFAFLSDARNENLPHNYESNFVAYTGTHDNDTTLGWVKSTKGEERAHVKKYLKGTSKKALRNAVECVWSSVADTAIVPMQDVLELGTKARMNTPGVANGNWSWRFQWKQLKTRQKTFLKTITEMYYR